MCFVFTMLRVRNSNMYKSWSGFNCISTAKMLKAGKLEEEYDAVCSVYTFKKVNVHVSVLCAGQRSSVRARCNQFHSTAHL